MPLPLTPEQTKEIDILLHAGNKIGAIKLYRSYSGSDLKDAKEAVESRSHELGIQESVPLNSRKSGCLGMVLLFLTPAALLAWFFQSA